MGIKVAINGYGRIGRQILRAIYDYKLEKQLDIVAVNASGSLETNAHLTKFDTIHGRFNADVSHDENHLIINGKKIPFFSTRNPAELPWALLGVDLVMECTGAFTSKAGQCTSRIRREKSADFCARRCRCGCHRGIWCQPQRYHR